jgi:hypothetical protein
LTNLERSLDDLKELVRDPPPGVPDDVHEALARFLVVRTCGFLEQVTEACVKSYLQSKSDPRAFSFGSSWLGSGRNPKPDQLVDIVRRLDAAWARELREMFEEDDDYLKREISLLVDRRNKIAHGVSVGMGPRKALDLTDRAQDVSRWFVVRLDPR